MKILVAPDKFKGSLDAQGVCEALAVGLKANDAATEVIAHPLADGGDGSLQILQHYKMLRKHVVMVKDPLLRAVEAFYYTDQTTAFIELSLASGLVLLHPAERDCTRTSTLGTGELIVHAIQQGFQNICLFIGGSATNDAGLGIAAALGYRFLDKKRQPLLPNGANLQKITQIDGTKVNLKNITIKIVSDVANPFYGENGAARVYAAQKGANNTQIEALDQGLRHIAKRFKAQGYGDISAIPGAGAAGGVGGGAIALLGAELISGTHYFLALTQFETMVKKVDLVITGEGRLDAQSLEGKVVSGVITLARQYGKPVVVVCGDYEPQAALELEVERRYSVLAYSSSIKEAMEKVYEKLIEIGAIITMDGG